MNATTDVLVIGGGVMGLAIAVELRLRGAAVTVLSRDFQQAASHAAAGMLAPQAEALPDGPMAELCRRSQRLYPDWVSKLEDLSGASTHYWACGILMPLFETPGSEQLAQASPTERLWLDRTAIQAAQPGLGSGVIGGWWLPEEGQVDNRALAQVLRQVAEILGVQLREGVGVTAIQQSQGQVMGLATTAGTWRAEQYVLATGAWGQELLPLPVQPRKGQMLAVSTQGNPQLHRILYGDHTYIVPRQDGRIVIGATSEAVGFAAGNTPQGLHQLLAGALRLYPALGDLPILESWWGFRPATPDDLPILGASPCSNLTLATGHYRNGILLTPITAQLIADQVWSQQTDPLLAEFSWQRFYRSPAPVTPVATPPVTPVSSSACPPVSLPQTQMLQFSHPQAATQPSQPHLPELDDPKPLVIAGRTFRSRLMTGTGKYRNFDDMRQSVVASGCEIVTVAVRRVQTNAPGHEGLAEALDWEKIWMLPNTAGCQTAEEAIRVARLGREMAKLLGQEDNNFVKLEVIPDAKYLLPDPIGTLEAAEKLVQEGFAVLPYINADPLLAKRLEEAGCATVMPLGSPIGSGQGIKNLANIQIIIENAQVPVVVDAGIGTPSEVATAMELGADALLINTAIAQAQNPALMAQAMGLAAVAGRMAYLAGRIPIKAMASPSSPVTGTITS
ncbi:MAG: glycine oxidase ThiO [Elainella sp.]